MATRLAGTAEFPVHTSTCGFIFPHKEIFSAFHGRDVTFRNVLHSRGINMEEHRTGLALISRITAALDTIRNTS